MSPGRHRVQAQVGHDRADHAVHVDREREAPDLGEDLLHHLADRHAVAFGCKSFIFANNLDHDANDLHVR